MAADGSAADDEPKVDFFNDAFVAADAVHGAVEAVIQSGGDMLYDHYLEERTLPFAVSRVMEDMRHMVNFAFLSRSESVGGPAGQAWAAEEEPAAPTIESWARGAVTVKRQSKSRYEEVEEQLSATNPAARSAGGPASVGSRRSRRTGMTRGSSRDSKQGEQAGPSKPQLIQRPQSPPPGAPGSNRPPSPSAAVRAKALADARAIEAEKERRAQAAAKEAAREKELEDKMVRDLKGRDFTFNADGSVMVVTPVVAAKLPQQFTQVGVAIDVPEPEGKPHGKAPRSRRGSRVADPAAAAAGAAAGGGGGKEDPDKGKGKGKKKVEDEFFTESGTVQPPLVETIVLAPGVVLTEGEVTVDGPPAKEDPLHMSRKEFSLHQTMLETGTMSGTLGTADGFSGLGGLGATTMGASDSRPMTNASGAGGSRGADPATEAGGGPAVDASDLPDYDPTAGALSGSPGAGGGGGGGVEGSPGTAASPVRDVNLMLTQDPSWGVNIKSTTEFSPTQLPEKPNTRQRENAVGRRPKLPRDRPFGQKPEGPRKHQPPPMYPAVTRYEQIAKGGPSATTMMDFVGSTASSARGGGRDTDVSLPPIPGAQASDGGSYRAMASMGPDGSLASPKRKNTFGRPTRMDSARDRTGLLNVTPAGKQALGLK